MEFLPRLVPKQNVIRIIGMLPREEWVEKAKLQEHLVLTWIRFNKRFFEAKRKLIKTDKKLTAEKIKNLVIGKDTRKKVHGVWGISISQLSNGCFSEPGICTRHIGDIKLLTTHPIFWNHEFIAELCVLARKRRKYDHYTTVKYPANFKKIVIRCLKNR